MSLPRRGVRTYARLESQDWDFSPPETVEHYVIGGSNLVATEGHDYRNLNSRGLDKGGAFLLRKSDYSESDNPQPGYVHGWFFNHVGPFKAYAADVGEDSDVWPSVPFTNQLILNGYGTTAIARVLPTNPHSDLAQFIGELREGLPRLGVDSFRSRIGTARSAGSDYLNYQFGWKPLVNDLRNFASAVKSQEKILSRYERNSGRALRRSIDLVDTETVQYDILSEAMLPKPDVNFWIANDTTKGVLSRTTTRKHRVWFSGCFTYYLPPPSSGAMKSRLGWLSKANSLLGVRPTPETLWNLTPWSWAADWVYNTGDVYHNISAFAQDGLVMPYAYLMETVEVSDRYDLKGVYFNNGADGPFDWHQTFTTTVKSRSKATPYGFGLTPEVDFSQRQLAIIASLFSTRGATRHHRR